MNEKFCPTLRERVAGFLRSDALVVLFFAATNLLLHLICVDRYGYFRDELYYQLKVVPLVVPSLRERADDKDGY